MAMVGMFVFLVAMVVFTVKKISTAAGRDIEEAATDK